MKKSKKVIALALAAVMAVSVFAGCGGGTEETSKPAESTSANNGETTPSQGETTSAKPTTPAKEISILMPNADHAYDEDPLTIEFRQKIEEYTNTKITWELYDGVSYYEKLTLKYASGELATIMVTDQNAEFQNACQYNVFWDVLDYIDLFDNLTTIPYGVRVAASQGGGLYGIPRARANMARNATAYRQDWADALNIGTPETLDQFYEMLVAFTNDDPDGNGKNDTYGLSWDAWLDVFRHMAVWFGAPHNWGLNESGDLEYYATTEEWRTAVKWFRQMYSEGLVPADFLSVGAGSNRNAYVQNGMCGTYIQCADNMRKIEIAMRGTEEAPGAFPNASWTYIPGVDTGFGYRVRPQNAGYTGYIAITKSLAPTEEDLMACLNFLNAMNDAEMTNMINYGIEGKDWYLDEEGYVYLVIGDERTAAGLGSQLYRNGYNQIVPYFHNAEEAAKLVSGRADTEAQQKEAAIYELGKQYIVSDYSLGLESAKYVEVGADLNAILDGALTDYITGVIDDTAYDAAIEQWYGAGGTIVIEEMNAAYDAMNN
ncbi:MAG: extracellular solute-binding protein [Lachnospiraceae bacterium]|nr:extracellular solute-binding protein [Lachnospiraceae bacterium]